MSGRRRGKRQGWERETGMGKREKERETGMGEKDRKRENNK